MGGGGGWWWVVGGGPMIIVTRISLKLPISIGYCLESMKSDLVNIISSVVNFINKLGTVIANC